MAITNRIGWMITPPAIAMMRSTMPRIRSIWSSYPASDVHNLAAAQDPLTGWFTHAITRGRGIVFDPGALISRQ